MKKKLIWIFVFFLIIFFISWLFGVGIHKVDLVQQQEVSFNFEKGIAEKSSEIYFGVDKSVWAITGSGRIIKKWIVIDNEIESFEGENENLDLKFLIPKEDLVKAILNNNSVGYFKESIKNGETQIEVISGEVELFAKGYLGFYDSLK